MSDLTHGRLAAASPAVARAALDLDLKDFGTVTSATSEDLDATYGASVYPGALGRGVNGTGPVLLLRGAEKWASAQFTIIN